MNMIMTNNDARLYILINGKWRKILTTELEVTASFSPTSYGISGEVYERNFVGQGTLEGSFKTPHVLENDLDPEVILVSKYLEKLTVPEHQSILNGHRLKVVQLNPKNPDKVYREITFTAALSANEWITSDLNDLTYLSFDIAFQGDLKINNSPSEGENPLVSTLPGKLFFEAGEEVKNGSNAKLTKAQFNVLNKNGLPIKIKAGVLTVRIFQTGIANPVYTIRVAKDNTTAKLETSNLATPAVNNLIVIKNDEYGDFSVENLILKNQEKFTFNVTYKYWIDKTEFNTTLDVTGKLDTTTGGSYVYIPNAL